MFTIRKAEVLADKVKAFVVEAPHVAHAAKPGNFVLVRGDEKGERIPLTIADSDAEMGTITLVLQEVGKGTLKLGAFKEGEAFIDVVGPLGKNREFHAGGQTICCVSGGLGVAPMYPQTKAAKQAGNRVISIVGARNTALFFWQDRIADASDETYYITDDGSSGRKGFATQILEELIQKGEKFDEVIAIGPVPHMKAVVNCCKKHNLPVVVSLNPIMVDGTGMCGGCRVSVGGKTKYACVDGPEFDGAEVDFDELTARQGAYRALERKAVEELAQTYDPGHACRLETAVQELEAGKRKTLRDFETDSVALVANAIGKMAHRRSSFDEVNEGYGGARRGRGVALPLVQTPFVHEGVPGRSQHPRIHPSHPGTRFRAGRRYPQGQEQSSRHLRPRLPAGKPMRKDVCPRAQFDAGYDRTSGTFCGGLGSASRTRRAEHCAGKPPQGSRGRLRTGWVNVRGRSRTHGL